MLSIVRDAIVRLKFFFAISYLDERLLCLHDKMLQSLEGVLGGIKYVEVVINERASASNDASSSVV